MSVDLGPYQEALSSGGLDAVQKLPGFFSDLPQSVPDNPTLAGEHFEALAFDALTLGQNGWACVCMGAAKEQFSRLQNKESIARCVEQNLRILEEAFRPYPDFKDFQSDLLKWIHLRVDQKLIDQTAAQEAKRSPFTEDRIAKQNWWFSLVRTRRAGTRFESDTFLDSQKLSEKERILIWSVCSFPEEALNEFRVEMLLDIFCDTPAERNEMLSTLGPKQRLRKSGMLVLIPDSPRSKNIEKWLLKLHPELHSQIQGKIPKTSLQEKPPSKIAIWKEAFQEAGLLPPLDLEGLVDRLPDQDFKIRKICSQLSAKIWLSGLPEFPVPSAALMETVERINSDLTGADFSP